MIKLLSASVFVLSASCVVYSQVDDLDPAKIKRGAVEYVAPMELKRFPVPPIIYRNDLSEHEDLKESLADKVIYPFLCESEVPVSLVIVDFCSDMLKSEYKGQNACRKNFKGEIFVEVEIVGADGSDSVAWIGTNKNGSFDNNAHLRFFPPGYVPKRNCVGEGEKLNDAAPKKGMHPTPRRAPLILLNWTQVMPALNL